MGSGHVGWLGGEKCTWERRPSISQLHLGVCPCGGSVDRVSHSRQRPQPLLEVLATLSQQHTMQRVLAASCAQTQMVQRQPVGLSGSGRAAAARLAPAGRTNPLRAAAPAAQAPARQRAAMRVAATADPAVKLTGDDLKEANRKAMRTVRCKGAAGSLGGGTSRWRHRAAVDV